MRDTLGRKIQTSQYCLRLPKSVYEKLNVIKNNTGESINTLLLIAISEFLEKQ